MPVVALTGGIAAGKTAVSDELVASGIRVIDADQLARDVVAVGSPALAAIAERFGPEILTRTGELDRSALGALIFADPVARADLNAIVHPAVSERSTQLFAHHAGAHPDQPLVYAVPLLVETGRADEFDLVVVVDAPASMRVERLVATRGMTPEDAQSRVSSQATDQERLDAADVVIDASESLESTTTQAQLLASALKAHWPNSLEAIPRSLAVLPE